MPAGPHERDALLASLDDADRRLRALYSELADDPDLAGQHDAAIRELRLRREELARAVGLAALAGWRAAQRPPELAPEPPASSAPVVAAPVVAAPEVEATGAPAAPELPPPPPDEPASEPPPPPSAPGFPPPPVSAEDLQRFKAAFSAPASRPAVAPRKDDRPLLLALASHVRIAPELSTAEAFDQEVDQLEKATTSDQQKRWRKLTKEAQVRWLSFLVAWAKALERDADRLGALRAGLGPVFRELRGYSIADNPGFVHGFARSATPRWGGTWREDAFAHLREIRPEPGAEAPPATKAKARAKKAEEPDEAPEGDEADELAGWRYRDRARGLRVVVLGGEVREERRVALERAFGFASLEWVPTDRPRLVASLAERAERGSVDVILVTKFASHGGSVSIQRTSKAPFLTMRHGYGVTTVRQVLEEWFARVDGGGKGDRRRSG